jgi:hypothetical protein
MKGWVKLHRKIFEWEWYKSTNTKAVFLHLVLRANHEPKRWRGAMIDRGQVAIGRSNLSTETGISVQAVRTALNNLRNSGEITIKSTSKYSIITICNYSEYQVLLSDDNQQGNQQSTSGTTSNQPANQPQTRSKEVKKREDISSAAGKPPAKRRTAKPKTDGSRVWEAYADEYRRRYRCDPVRDARANTVCANLVKALGASEAPEIARWYVGSNDSWFVRRKHPIGDLLSNAQRFATEWRQGHRGTATEAMDQDRRAEQAGVYDRVIEKIDRGEL